MTRELPQDVRKRIIAHIKETARSKGLTASDIASKTGMKDSNVRRMLLGNHSPGLDNFISVCKAVGVKFNEFKI